MRTVPKVLNQEYALAGDIDNGRSPDGAPHLKNSGTQTAPFGATQPLEGVRMGGKVNDVYLYFLCVLGARRNDGSMIESVFIALVWWGFYWLCSKVIWIEGE